MKSDVPMTHAEWRKAFRHCEHKERDPTGRCSHRPNGNPLCGLFVRYRCTFNICPLKNEKGRQSQDTEHA